MDVIVKKFIDKNFKFDKEGYCYHNLLNELDNQRYIIDTINDYIFKMLDINEVNDIILWAYSFDFKFIINHKNKQWYKNGNLHRDNGPAYICPDGYEAWYKDGLRHREDGPAITESNGTEHWYLNGELHREDGPAIIHPDGTQYWLKHGILHREGGPAVIYSDGSEDWIKNGIRIQKR